jgi:hypothetical protein
MVREKLAPQVTVLVGAETGAVLKIKATIIIGKIKSPFGHQKFFFPCGGMAVVKSLLYVNKN